MVSNCFKSFYEAMHDFIKYSTITWQSRECLPRGSKSSPDYQFSFPTFLRANILFIRTGGNLLVTGKAKLIFCKTNILQIYYKQYKMSNEHLQPGICSKESLKSCFKVVIGIRKMTPPFHQF